LMFFVMILGIAIIIFSKCAMLADLLACATAYIVKYFHFLLQGLHQFNPKSFQFLHLSILDLLWVYGIIGFAAYFIIHKKKYALFFSLGSTLLLLISFTIKNIQVSRQESIVVYNIQKHARTEIIFGKNHTVISEDTTHLTPKTIDYAVKENHILHRAWKEKRLKKPMPLIRWQQKKILFLKQPLE